ncbi:hypothetical protein INT80_15325 [Gallibacterium anatis]|uniref:Uncharacterized protein n=1 Tax=Gallibacterium anatis TaxID=750 RepID=A0A930UXQ6_9PAST|nr:hypothetical protein [Gallibacterium anatis]
MDELADALNNDKLEIVALHYATVSLPQKGKLKQSGSLMNFWDFGVKRMNNRI